MKQNEGFAVALTDPAAEPLAPLAFLSGRGLGRDAARAFLRSQPGFLGRALTQDAAAELAAAAGTAGFRTLIAAESAIAPPLPPIKVLKLDVRASGFGMTAGGAVKFVPFTDVGIISAAAYEAPVPPVNIDVLKAGLFVKMLRLAGAPVFSPVSESGSKETYFRADIVAEKGQLRLLLEPENMDFSPLGAARSPSSLENFKLLLDRVSAPCFGAVKNAFLAAFLGGRPLTALKLSSAEACDTGLSRLLLAAGGAAR